MAFSDYTSISQVQREFGITYKEANYIVTVPLDPPVHFVEEFEFNQKNRVVTIFSINKNGAATRLPRSCFHLARSKTPPRTTIGVGAASRVCGAYLPVVVGGRVQRGKSHLGGRARAHPTSRTSIFVRGVDAVDIAGSAAANCPAQCYWAANACSAVTGAGLGKGGWQRWSTTILCGNHRTGSVDDARATGCGCATATRWEGRD